MRNSISRTLIAGLGALAMTAAFMLPGATGASAGFGFHVGVAGVRPMGGFGGFHGAPMGVHPAASAASAVFMALRRASTPAASAVSVTFVAREASDQAPDSQRTAGLESAPGMAP